MIIIDHGATAALRKIGNPPSFSVCGWNALDDGSVIYQMMEELPREAGCRRKWTGPVKKACVTRNEVAEEERRYETETGKCSLCGGTKRMWAGWSTESGNKYRPCTRCGETGVPRAQLAQKVSEQISASDRCHVCGCQAKIDGGSACAQCGCDGDEKQSDPSIPLQ